MDMNEQEWTEMDYDVAFKELGEILGRLKAGTDTWRHRLRAFDVLNSLPTIDDEDED
jgi:hypothetical protein